MQPLNGVRRARTLPLVRWQSREGEELLAGFRQAVGNGAALEPPFANERFATCCHLLRCLGVDHVGEVRRDLLSEPLRSVSDQITELVDGAALNKKVRPQTSQRSLEPRR